MEKFSRLKSTDKNRLDVLILAAGLGTRMKSRKPKVLHELGGRPLIEYVCRTAQALEPRRLCVVVGYQAEEVQSTVEKQIGPGIRFVIQPKQSGTGDAVMSARDDLNDENSELLILSGDVPLIRPETLSSLVEHHRSTGAICTILGVRLENPTGYGRIIRDENGHFLKIVEQKDATPEEREVREINSGFYCFDTKKLFGALDRVQPLNKQGEYYLTDVPSILLEDGEKVEVYLHSDSRELIGINTRAELAEFENLIRRRAIRSLMVEGGVTFIDPSHAYIGSDVRIGRDCTVHPDVTIEGNTVIGEGCVIRSGTRITNSQIGDQVVIKDHCVIVDSQIASNTSVGPFAHLRMNAQLEEGAAVGNFVEIKKSRLGRRSKSMHLTYLGDATIGENTNIGAGTVTCNYDGKQKHQTIIEDNVRIGSDTMLVAPVKVGRGSITGAGSVITKDVPSNSLVAGVPAVIKKRLERNDEE
jgi:bifunctional UDP-N-acetylglucosamine pyrophosphorylase/glucosamine-1-phosphate N-acetyltransferase